MGDDLEARAANALDPPSRAREPGLKVTRFRDMQSGTRRRDLIKGLVPPSGFGIWFGPSGSGKTFSVNHAAMCIAAGRDFLGLRVHARRPVVIVSPENPWSSKTRYAAWRTELQLDDDLQLAIIEGSIDMVDKRAFAALRERIVEMAAEYGGLALIVIDTVSQAMPGADENSSDGMTAFVGACQALRQEFDCAVIGVHHTGKDQLKGARGHSSLRAAVDVEISVSDAGGCRELEVTKMRDGPIGLKVPFRLTPIVIGQDDDGDDITTCVVEPGTEAPRQTARPKGKNQILVFQALERCVSIAGSPPAGRPMSRIRAVRLQFLRDAAGPTEFGHIDAKHRSSRIAEGLSGLKASGFADGDDEWIWIAPRFSTPETDRLIDGSVRAVPPKAPKQHRSGIRGDSGESE